MTPDPRPAYYAVNCVHPFVIREVLRDVYGLKVLGGCCDTDDHHIAALAERLMVAGH